MHPSFRSKTVCQLSCKYCVQPICTRGMKAILLADTRVELYSTDTVPAGRVQLVAEDYLTRNCNCRIRDVACLGCGNVIGYHVTQPCDVCMSACNNGHYWMFHDDSISSRERLDPAGKSLY
ncbi:protein FAM72 [Chytriomyces sp. MP71]|nr:protein FAM72 [Chytriomyces sp. MP71]